MRICGVVFFYDQKDIREDKDLDYILLLGYQLHIYTHTTHLYILHHGRLLTVKCLHVW